MILVLTYHQVRETPPGTEPNFYTITGAQLDRQLGMLHENGHSCMRIEELLGAKTIPERRYVLTFDDATADHHEVVFPLLEKHRCQGVFFVPTATLNTPGCLTDAQISEMAAAGHAVESHGHEHRRMDTMTDEEMRGQIAQSQKILAGLTGKSPVSFAPPGGFVNDRMGEIVSELGLRAMRTMRWGYNEKFDLLALETIPINRHVNGRKFMRVLDGRRTPLLYAGKETLKRLVPLPMYEKMRRLLFSLSKSD